MDLGAEATMPNFPASNSSTTESQTSTKPFFKLKRKLAKKGKSKDVHEDPDLDIVSGFAFLSFSNIADLEYHIAQNEAKSCSLSINVGVKRRKRRQKEAKAEVSEVVRSSSKRIRVPSQKILESYATKDVPITELVGFGSKQPIKIKQEKESSSYLHEFNDHSPELSSKTSFSWDNADDYDANSDSLLECSETIDVCVFDDDDEYSPTPGSTNITNAENIQAKKMKKKKRSAEINDTSCQTMFRIKKKKKKHRNTESSINPTSSSATGELCQAESFSTVSQDSSLSEFPDSEIIVKNIDTPNVYIIKEESYASAKERYKQMQATKFFDSKQNRPKLSNKVEKIDYCARSGGLELVSKHRERQARMKEQSDLDSLHESLHDNDLQEHCNASINSDNSSSSNEVVVDPPPADKEGLLCNKSRIFAGSTSISMTIEESQNESDIDIDGGVDDSMLSNVNIVKALPGNYLFGHFSTYPDKSTEGTIDVSIQIYESDIQLYMNYASDFNGKVIKIITPDNEETKNIPCLPNAKSQSGGPKFLQPQEYAKAIRSATERNRRHNLGDLFNHLKKEIFGDVREFYFSKQAILTKALEVISNTDQEYYELSKERAKLSAKNQLLRKSLNGLLFGETDECEKKVDVDKVTDCLKTMGIEIKMPKSRKQAIKVEKEESVESSDTPKSNVTKKGRPPIAGKLFKTIEIPAPGKKEEKPASCESEIKDDIKVEPLSDGTGLRPLLPASSIPVNVKDNGPTTTAKPLPPPNAALIDANMKAFVTIAPKEPLQHDTPKDPKELPVELPSTDKIVCNVSRYRLGTIGEKSGMTMITKQAEPFKSVESSKVVHIKISNDVMEQITPTDNATNNSGQSTTKGKLVELSQLSSATSLSTQTDFDALQPCTDYNSNSIKPLQQPSIPNPSTTGVNQSNDEIVKPIVDSSVTMATTAATATVSTSKPLVLKASDKLNKLVNILRQRTLTHTLPATDINSRQSTLSSSCISDTDCSSSSSSTITNALPQIVQSTPANSAVRIASTQIVSTQAAKETVTMTTAAQALKVNLEQTTMTNSNNVAMTTSAVVSLTTPVNVTMATPKPSVPIARPIAMATTVSPAHVSTVVSKSVAITTTSQFPIIAQMCSSKMPSPNSFPTVTAAGKPLQPAVSNVMNSPQQQQQKLISVLPQPSVQPAVKGGVPIMPKNPIRIVFRPPGKPGSTPGDQAVLQLPLSTALSSNLLQGNNIRFLLQKTNPVIQQPGNVTSQSQSSIPPKLRMVSPGYGKPLVKIQPLPLPFQSPVNLQHSQPPTAGKNASMPIQSQLVVSGITTSLNVCPSTSSAAPPTTFINQPLLVNTGASSESMSNQTAFSQGNSGNNTVINLSQPVSTLMPKQPQPIIAQNPPVSSSDISKTPFTGMEQVVAKIPLTTMPQQNMPLKRKFCDLLPNPLKTMSVKLQRLQQDSQVTKPVANKPPQVISSSVQQPTTTFISSDQSSLNTVDVNQAKIGCLTPDEIATSFANENPRNVPSQLTVPCSSTCSSVTFQLTEPQQDKTCSVVERTVDNSNVVTADKLSVWNIDSSIPDIKSELQGGN